MAMDISVGLRDGEEDEGNEKKNRWGIPGIRCGLQVEGNSSVVVRRRWLW